MKRTIIGIDWSRTGHQVNVYNESGQTLAKVAIPHTKQGFEKLTKTLLKIEPEPANCLVAIETQHNQIVDYLLANQYPVYVIAPSVVKGNRSRQSNAGAKTDDKDAALLADIVRTDQRRLLPWQPDSATVRTLRVQMGLIDDITTAIVRGHHRLEAHLLRYFPQAIDVFSQLTTQIALQLLIAYPSPAAVAQLDYATFAAFCQQHRYRNTKQLPKRFARLKRPNPHTDPLTITCFSPSTPILAQRLLADVKLKITLTQQLQDTFSPHPDAFIYNSLPGAGPLLAPKLLTLFGDQPQRFPNPDIIRALAGTCPATSQSGNSRSVFFRKACNKSWRDTLQMFAKSSTSQSTWAATYFETALLRGLSKSHAYRCLANRWVSIIWTLQQRRQPYDEAVHWRHLRQFKH